jgi:hypothetical protein
VVRRHFTENVKANGLKMKEMWQQKENSNVVSQCSDVVMEILAVNLKCTRGRQTNYPPRRNFGG